jgi:hypothetical protein
MQEPLGVKQGFDPSFHLLESHLVVALPPFSAGSSCTTTTVGSATARNILCTFPDPLLHACHNLLCLSFFVAQLLKLKQ